MAVIDHDAALAKAGANVSGFWSQAGFLAPIRSARWGHSSCCSSC